MDNTTLDKRYDCIAQNTIKNNIKYKIKDIIMNIKHALYRKKYNVNYFIKNSIVKTSLWAIRKVEQNSSYVKYAKGEMAILSNQSGEADKYQNLMTRYIVDIISVISSQGHSGFSINYLASTIEKLMLFKPLSKLRFTDDEFTKCCDDMYQNKRDSRIFKYENGEIAFNYALSKKHGVKLSYDDLNKTICKFDAYTGKWCGPLIVIPKSGKPYLVSNIRVNDLSKFDRQEFTVNAIEIEYPKDWWMSVCRESELEEFSKIYKFDKDYEHAEKEINYKDGKYNKIIRKLFAEAKRELYKTK